MAIRNTLLIALSVPAVLICMNAPAVGNGCIDCHKDESFYATNPKLYRYYQDWINSPHNEAGVTCNECHGGNPDGNTVESGHKGMFPMSDSRSTLYYSRQPDTCGDCHTEKKKEFEQSKHFKALQSATGTAPTCTTCHPAMNRRPAYQTIVLNACTTCHHEGNRQGLPNIVNQAENLLRNVNVAQGMLGWAKLHFASLEWPGDSREHIQSLEDRYATLVDQVHRFNLQQSDKETMELLTELKLMFEAERRAAKTTPSP